MKHKVRYREHKRSSGSRFNLQLALRYLFCQDARVRQQRKRSFRLVSNQLLKEYRGFSASFQSQWKRTIRNLLSTHGNTNWLENTSQFPTIPASNCFNTEVCRLSSITLPCCSLKTLESTQGTSYSLLLNPRESMQQLTTQHILKPESSMIKYSSHSHYLYVAWQI